MHAYSTYIGDGMMLLFFFYIFYAMNLNIYTTRQLPAKWLKHLTFQPLCLLHLMRRSKVCGTGRLEISSRY